MAKEVTLDNIQMLYLRDMAMKINFLLKRRLLDDEWTHFNECIIIYIKIYIHICIENNNNIYITGLL